MSDENHAHRQEETVSAASAPVAHSSFKLNFILGITGALLGGIAGHYAFLWILRQGFYAIILPGTLVGLGCKILSRRKSLSLSLTCAALALIFGLYTEWKFAPFVKDESLFYFFTHIHQLKPITLIMIGLGTVCGFWFAERR